MSAQRAPRVTIEPVGSADPDSFLAAIEDTLQAGELDRSSVVISVEEPAALPDYTMGSEDAQDAESAAPSEDGPQDADALPCGHASIYAESGTCLLCDQSFNTDEEKQVKRAAACDGREGRL